METYLVHHGVKGQKWGVRRYQNEDGTLTEAGKSRYLNSSSGKVYKRLKKEIRSERAKQHGGSNRWMFSEEIGPRSRELRKQEQDNQQKYENSKAYKAWSKKWTLWKKTGRQGHMMKAMKTSMPLWSISNRKRISSQ